MIKKKQANWDGIGCCEICKSKQEFSFVFLFFVYFLMFFCFSVKQKAGARGSGAQCAAFRFSSVTLQTGWKVVHFFPPACL